MIDSSGADETVNGNEYTRFDITHLAQIVTADDFENAYAEKSGGTQKLNVYRSDADLVLMMKREAQDNDGTRIPETSEMQYPCENSVDITINKIWDKQGDPLVTALPASITVNLYRRSSADNYFSITLIDSFTLTGADQNSAFTANVWSLKVEDLPASYEENGVVYYYRYEASENSVYDAQGNPYYQAVVSSEDGYTWNLFNTHCGDQVVVVDYGIPMNVSALEYLRIKFGFSESDLTLLGLSGTTILNHGIYYQKQDSYFANPYEGIYGTNQINGEKISYQLNEMEMRQTEQTAMEVQAVEDGRTTYVHTTVTFVPASMIYYEDTDRFVAYSENDWTVLTGTGAASAQDEDRPDVDEILKAYEIDHDNVYGYDSAYENSATYGLGSTHKTTVTAANNPQNGGSWPYAEFTFTGVGFDVISLSDSNSGTVRIQVLKMNESTGQFTQFKNWLVDTFYGYKRTEDGYSRTQFRLVDGQWHTHRDLVSEKGNDETGLPMISQAQEGVTYVVYEKHYIWEPDTTGGRNTLYQVPVISSEDHLKTSDNPTGYGTYKVRVIPMYSASFDHLNKGSYDLYLDGVRIYSPVETEMLEEINETYYKVDREGWPEFFELRDMLISEKDVEEDTINGVLFIDNVSALDDADEYMKFGPNNEIYLSPGQSITFGVNVNAQVADLQVSAKKLQAEDVTLGISIDNEMLPDVQIVSASEMYRSIIPADMRFSEGIIPVTITNKSANDESVSIVKLKVTYTQNPEAPAELVVTAPMMRMAKNVAFAQYVDGITTCFHTYLFAVTSMPTATVTGEAIGVCKDCGDTVTVELPALSDAHYECTEITAATCTGAGEIEYLLTETEYGDVAVSVEIEALGHQFEHVWNGDDYVLQCSRCGLIDDDENDWNIFRFLRWLIDVLTRFMKIISYFVNEM